MAISTEEVPNLTGMVPDPELFPSQLPEGVQKTSQWYAHRRTYRDGRQVWEFFKRGSGGGPVGPDGKPGDAVAATIETEVPALKEKWDKEEGKSPTVRNINGVPSNVVGKDADGNDIWAPVNTANGPATAAASTAKDWRTEGTPLPGGSYDNSKPTMAAYVNGKRTGETRAPTAKELEDWNLAGQMTRNPGGKTDKEIADEKEKADATARSNRASELSALKPGTTVSTIGGKKYTTIVTPSTTPGGRPTITHLGPDNQPIASLPTDPPESTSTAITRNGQTYIQTSTKRPDGSSGVTFTDTAGKPVSELPREGAVTLPPGMPELDTSTPEAARASYLAQVRWAQQQQRDGKMTRQEVIDLLTPSHQAAETVVSAAQQQIENARASRGQDISQEGNRLQAAGSQFSNAQRASEGVFKVGPAGGSQTADVIAGSILLQQIMGRNPLPPGSAPGVTAGPAEVPLTTPAVAGAAGGPNAIGLGAIGAVPAPTGVPAVDAIAQAAAVPSAADVAAQNAATQAQSQAALGVAPVAPPALPSAPGPLTSPAQAPGEEPKIRVRDQWGNEFEMTQQQLDNRPGGSDDLTPVSQMPAAVQRLQGRAIIDSIMPRYGGAAA